MCGVVCVYVCMLYVVCAMVRVCVMCGMLCMVCAVVCVCIICGIVCAVFCMCMFGLCAVVCDVVCVVCVVCMCGVCMCTCTYKGTGGQKRVLYCLELELQMLVNHLIPCWELNPGSL